MKVQAQSVTDLLDGKNTHFLIPSFQRPYEWIAKEQCKTLFDDLTSIANLQNPHPHFFGSVVCVRDIETDDNILIDGQQRLTTISLLLLAIAHKIDELSEITDKPLPDKHEVLSLCLDYKNKNKLKLKLSQKDMAAYECVLGGRCNDYNNSNVVKSYKFFKSSLTEENIKSIYDAISFLHIVYIRLTDEDDNPQKVFESLNAKGLKLTDAAKICNYILIGTTYNEQNRLYENFWHPMEENAGLSSDDTTQYIWRFIQYKTNQKIGDKETYSKFKQFYPDANKEQLLSEMLEMSKVYHDIMTKKVRRLYDDTLNEAINTKLRILLQDLKMHTTVPLLMDVINKYYKKQIIESDVVELLTVLESYIVRRNINHMPTTIYNGFFLMNLRIDKLLQMTNEGSYLDVFKYLINDASGRFENPNNDSVLESLIHRDIYNSNINICKHILATVEQQHNPKERVDTVGLTIEHVMPQNLNGRDGDTWKEELGPDWERVHDKYLHTLGNLTLTGYNSEYSNKTFKYKKRMQNGGFDYSPLYLNSFMKNTDVWNEEVMQNRGEQLARQILKLWPIFPSQYKYSMEKNIDKFLLNNDTYKDAISGRKPRRVRLEFMDGEIDVASWKDLYIQIINLLYNNAKYTNKMQRAFDYGNQGMFTGIISDTEEKRGKRGETLWEQIIPDNPVWFMVTKSSGDICAAIKVWLNYLDIPLDELEIYLK